MILHFTFLNRINQKKDIILQHKRSMVMLLVIDSLKQVLNSLNDNFMKAKIISFWVKNKNSLKTSKIQSWTTLKVMECFKDSVP